MLNYTPFTYLIGWKNLDKFYYGRRTAKNCNPDQLWKTYFTSSKAVKKFREMYGEPDIIKIRKKFHDDPKACINWECRFLKRINAAKNPKFLNLRNGDDHWDTTGMTAVKNLDGEIFLVSTTDPEYLSGKLMSIMRDKKQARKPTLIGTVTVKDISGNNYRVLNDDPRYLSGELMPVATGFVPVKDSLGNVFQTSKNDPKYLSGELKHFSSGTPNIKCKGMVTVRDKNKLCFNVSITDERYLSGELQAASKGLKRTTVTNRGKDPISVCPHCGKEGGERSMKRWHFDACRYKINDYEIL